MIRGKEMGLFCPSCFKEITPETTECQRCGYVFGPDTIDLLTDGIKEVLREDPDERRNHARVPRKFKVIFSNPKAFVNSYLFNISTGGLFVKTNEPPNQGEIINLKIILPDKKKGLEVLGEVIWFIREERVTAKGKFPPGMGVKFLNLSTQDKIRISTNIIKYSE